MNAVGYGDGLAIEYELQGSSFDWASFSDFNRCPHSSQKVNELSRSNSRVVLGAMPSYCACAIQVSIPIEPRCWPVGLDSGSSSSNLPGG
jgi:hypothetical protein